VKDLNSLDGVETDLPALNKFFWNSLATQA